MLTIILFTRSIRPIHNCYNNALISLVSIYRQCYMESSSTLTNLWIRHRPKNNTLERSFYDLSNGILVVQFDVTGNNGILDVSIKVCYNQCPVSMQTIFGQCDTLCNNI